MWRTKCYFLKFLQNKLPNLQIQKSFLPISRQIPKQPAPGSAMPEHQTLKKAGITRFTFLKRVSVKVKSLPYATNRAQQVAYC